MVCHKVLYCISIKTTLCGFSFYHQGFKASFYSNSSANSDGQAFNWKVVAFVSLVQPPALLSSVSAQNLSGLVELLSLC